MIKKFKEIFLQAAKFFGEILAYVIKKVYFRGIGYIFLIIFVLFGIWSKYYFIVLFFLVILAKHKVKKYLKKQQKFKEWFEILEKDDKNIREYFEKNFYFYKVFKINAYSCAFISLCLSIYFWYYYDFNMLSKLFYLYLSLENSEDYGAFLSNRFDFQIIKLLFYFLYSTLAIRLLELFLIIYIILYKKDLVKIKGINILRYCINKGWVLPIGYHSMSYKNPDVMNFFTQFYDLHSPLGRGYTYNTIGQVGLVEILLTQVPDLNINNILTDKVVDTEKIYYVARQNENHLRKILNTRQLVLLKLET